MKSKQINKLNANFACSTPYSTRYNVEYRRIAYTDRIDVTCNISKNLNRISNKPAKLIAKQLLQSTYELGSGTELRFRCLGARCHLDFVVEQKITATTKNTRLLFRIMLVRPSTTSLAIDDLQDWLLL